MLGGLGLSLEQSLGATANHPAGDCEEASTHVIVGKREGEPCGLSWSPLDEKPP